MKESKVERNVARVRILEEIKDKGQEIKNAKERVVVLQAEYKQLKLRSIELKYGENNG